jgi:uncharacterized protein (DUF488 family)
MKMGFRVFTIGHSNLPIDEFLALLKRHEVTAVADVRSAPYSRFIPHFNKDALQQKLKAVGIKYVFLGRELGARSDDPGCYEHGRVKYVRLARTDLFRGGIERVVNGAREHRIAIMCSEKEPLDCHRTILISPALVDAGLAVEHIHADGELEPHPKAMLRLLDVTGVPRQDLFRTRHELIEDALARQEERIAHVDMKFADEAEQRAL